MVAIAVVGTWWVDPGDIAAFKIKKTIDETFNVGQIGPGLNLNAPVVPVSAYVYLEATAEQVAATANPEVDLDAVINLKVNGLTIYAFTVPIIKHIANSGPVHVKNGQIGFDGEITITNEPAALAA